MHHERYIDLNLQLFAETRDSGAEETLSLGSDDLLPGALDLGEPEQDHEDEAKADAEHLNDDQSESFNNNIDQSEGLITQQ